MSELPISNDIKLRILIYFLLFELNEAEYGLCKSLAPFHRTIDCSSLQHLRHYLIQISYFTDEGDKDKRSYILAQTLAAKILGFWNIFFLTHSFSHEIFTHWLSLTSSSLVQREIIWNPNTSIFLLWEALVKVLWKRLNSLTKSVCMINEKMQTLKDAKSRGLRERWTKSYFCICFNNLGDCSQL